MFRSFAVSVICYTYTSVSMILAASRFHAFVSVVLIAIDERKRMASKHVNIVFLLEISRVMQRVFLANAKFHARFFEQWMAVSSNNLLEIPENTFKQKFSTRRILVTAVNVNFTRSSSVLP